MKTDYYKKLLSLNKKPFSRLQKDIQECKEGFNFKIGYESRYTTGVLNFASFDMDFERLVKSLNESYFEKCSKEDKEQVEVNFNEYFKAI